MGRRESSPNEVHPLVQAQFDQVAVDPGAWSRHAHQLIYVGDVLSERFSAAAARVRSEEATAVELADDLILQIHASREYGLAVENLLRAVDIKRLKPRPNELAKLIPGGHDLLATARRQGIDLSIEESDLLGRLSKYVAWAGRYPIPKKPTDMVVRQIGAQIIRKAENPHTGEIDEVAYPYVPLPMGQHERQIFSKIVEKIEREILS